MSVILPRALTPDASFLRELVIGYGRDSSGNPHVRISHPEARWNGSTVTVERLLLGLADGLGLAYGHAYPDAGRLLHYVPPIWALDYGHPDTALNMPPPPRDWQTLVRFRGFTFARVSLDPTLPTPPQDQRLFTGRIDLRTNVPASLI